MGAILLISWMLTDRNAQAPAVRTPVEEQVALQITELDTSVQVTEMLPLEQDSAAQITEIVQVDQAVPASEDSNAIEIPERLITVVIPDSTGRTIVRGEISTRGGEITNWELMAYEDLPGAEQSGHVNFAGTNWLGDSAEGGLVRFSYEGPDTLFVNERTELLLNTENGAWKKFTFDVDFYGFELERVGLGETTVLTGGVLPVSELEVDKGRYYHAVWYAEKLKKKSSNKIDAETSVGNVMWIGTTSRYFSILLFPMSFDRANGYIAPNGEEAPYVAIDDSRIRVYAGPTSYKRLSALGKNTNKLIDFGWPIIRWIGRLIFWFSNSVLSSVENWGLRIILVSIALKLVLFPLTTKSFTSMQKMQKVQPRMKEIQEKYKKDPKKQQAVLQKMYKEEGVNPLGGCLPLLLQMPVFFALYRVLANAVELRGAPFVLWITDLSRPEILIPFETKILGLSGIGLLAVLMGAAMFVQQKMTMVSSQQKGMMYMMPIIMVWLFMRFPAGLTLYWFTNNLLTIGQQEYIKLKLARGTSNASAQ
jgi:YidC/Oxa1 family membrane protein insertase